MYFIHVQRNLISSVTFCRATAGSMEEACVKCLCLHSHYIELLNPQSTQFNSTYIHVFGLGQESGVSGGNPHREKEKKQTLLRKATYMVYGPWAPPLLGPGGGEGRGANGGHGYWISGDNGGKLGITSGFKHT